MNKQEIEAYQRRIIAWSKNAEFKPYRLLGSEEFNFWYETLGIEEFWAIYDYSEMTTINIIKRLVDG